MCFFRGSWMKVETWSWKMLIPMLCLLLCPLLIRTVLGGQMAVRAMIKVQAPRKVVGMSKRTIAYKI